MIEESKIKEVVKEVGFYEPYSHFSRTLRTWLVAYGVGALVVLVSQERLTNVLFDSGCGLTISLLFLGGVVVQVLAALIYKYAMGIIYFSELKPDVAKSFAYKVADRISESFALEATLDIASVSCFAIGTFLVLKVALA